MKDVIAKTSVHPLSHKLEFRGWESFGDVCPALRATDYKAPPVVIIMEHEPINTDSEGLAYTINTRYGCMGYGNVSGGSHYPMTAVSEHDENYPPPTRKFRFKQDGKERS